ncbi:NAD-glutamate dehydrogenase [Ectothiorhodospiraceae bacterium WFHF3C12]|nr:NAD-glutamate dehydrogenase [Ectothiorhodospiraceae bacterium WFHF3C12]
MNPGAAAEAKRTDAIEAVVQRISRRWPREDQDRVQGFVRSYYAGVAPEDLVPREPADLYGAALCHWNLGARRRPGQPNLHVYNPDTERHGWDSTHTIVEIVTDDMPFLVDSVSMALNRLGLTIHLIVHPVLGVQRDRNGQIVSLSEKADADGHQGEAWMHFEVDRQGDEQRLANIRKDVLDVLEDVRLAVTDWQPMRKQLENVLRGLSRNPPPVEESYLEEVREFLRWIRDDHFTLLGYRRYSFVQHRGGEVLKSHGDSGLGLLREKGKGHISASFGALPEDVRRRAKDPAEVLIITKSNSRATVHRPGYMDYLGIKRYDAEGNVIGEHRFLGLYTSAAYNRNPRGIPLLRRKLEHVLGRARLRQDSHAGKALINILETHPRDELFQSEPDQLYETAKGILHLQERQRVRLFVRYDTYRRFVSCLVYAPRERYDTQVRKEMQRLLQDAFNGSQSEFAVQLSESVLARIHFIIRLSEPGQPEYDHAELEHRLAATMRSWNDDFHDALLEHFGEEAGNRLFERYGEAFGAAYREDTSPRAATHDLERLERIAEAGDLAMSLYRPLEAPEGVLRFKLFHGGHPITLSDVLPVLEHMGVEVTDEHPYDVDRADGSTAWIHDFGLYYSGAGQLEAEQIRDAFQDAFAAIWQQRAEDDGFNALVLSAGLSWRDIVVLRAYSKYLRQVGTPFSQQYVERTLASHPRITPLLVQLFHARLDPSRRDDGRAANIAEQMEALLEDVSSLDEDRILRRFLAAVNGTLRTNAFQYDAHGNNKDYLSFKVNPAVIPWMPKPVPAYEIFVYSLRTEGVHLRGGKVARGGIRASDRPEDFRTEILGLMKAQMVKNAVIVPVGAKGGFVVKQPKEDREAQAEETRACYRILISGLLDITDNMVEGGVEPPPQVIRRDEDDPYLVVAADKGTATFSDLANAIADEYGFWLRDAFASGGSSGYDHKKMGITARGAWEAVKRHFREMGKDIQNEPFTAVGVGDMSGDVFGNGMLLSRHTRLIAAFDHRHVFIDPDPDIERSYAERERLFHAGRTTWADYDDSLISEGGGVYPRTAKSIKLSEPARRALGVDAEQLPPNELIAAILKAPVDLLWNGGIGTYIKSSDESHADVGDKTNDAVRVNGEDLRCRVVGEGGNLGVTQLGRVEFCHNGGRMNTDAIDNSGGVDCSDHEVNIKVLLNQVVDDGDLTGKQRDELLAQMTEEVAGLVLRNNYRQTQGLSLSEHRAVAMVDEHGRFMRALEREGRLERQVEQLPDEEGLNDRQKSGAGLTRPELSVLQAYAKNLAYDALLESDVPELDYLRGDLHGYFPTPIRERFAGGIDGHRLRREILATVLANHVINRMGGTFLYRIEESTGLPPAAAIRAYLAARDVFDLRELWREIDALDNHVDSTLQTEMLLDLGALQERATLWLLHNLPAPLDIESAIARLQPAVAHLAERLRACLPGSDCEHLDARTAALAEAGVPEELAWRVARADSLFPALDLVKVCSETDADLEYASDVYYATLDRLGLATLRDRVDTFEAGDPWQERYRQGLAEEFFVQLRLLTLRVINSAGEAAAVEAVDAWMEHQAAMVNRLSQTLQTLTGTAQVDLAMLGVAIQELRSLAQSGAAHALADVRRG